MTPIKPRMRTLMAVSFRLATEADIPALLKLRLAIDADQARRFGDERWSTTITEKSVARGLKSCPWSTSNPSSDRSGRGAMLRTMTPIKTYPTRLEADLARIRLGAAGIPATIVGVGVGMEGGADVRLLVPDEKVDEALEVLRDS
jgi:hypothetical protein